MAMNSPPSSPPPKTSLLTFLTKSKAHGSEGGGGNDGAGLGALRSRLDPDGNCNTSVAGVSIYGQQSVADQTCMSGLTMSNASYTNDLLIQKTTRDRARFEEAMEEAYEQLKNFPKEQQQALFQSKVEEIYAKKNEENEQFDKLQDQRFKDAFDEWVKERAAATTTAQKRTTTASQKQHGTSSINYSRNSFRAGMMNAKPFDQIWNEEDEEDDVEDDQCETDPVRSNKKNQLSSEKKKDTKKHRNGTSSKKKSKNKSATESTEKAVSPSTDKSQSRSRSSSSSPRQGRLQPSHLNSSKNVDSRNVDGDSTICTTDILGAFGFLDDDTDVNGNVGVGGKTAADSTKNKPYGNIPSSMMTVSASPNPTTPNDKRKGRRTTSSLLQRGRDAIQGAAGSSGGLFLSPLRKNGQRHQLLSDDHDHDDYDSKDDEVTKLPKSTPLIESPSTETIQTVLTSASYETSSTFVSTDILTSNDVNSNIDTKKSKSGDTKKSKSIKQKTMKSTTKIVKTKDGTSKKKKKSKDNVETVTNDKTTKTRMLSFSKGSSSSRKAVSASSDEKRKPLTAETSKKSKSKDKTTAKTTLKSSEGKTSNALSSKAKKSKKTKDDDGQAIDSPKKKKKSKGDTATNPTTKGQKSSRRPSSLQDGSDKRSSSLTQ